MKISFTFCFVLFTLSLFAQKAEWTNATGNSKWSDVGNWAKGKLPSDKDDITISSDLGSQLFIDCNAEIGDLTIEGVTVVLEEGIDFTYKSIDGNGDLIVSKDVFLLPKKDKDGDINASGDLNVTILFEKSTLSSSYYSFISSPVQQASSNELKLFGARNVMTIQKGTSKDPQYSFYHVDGELEQGRGYAVNGNFLMYYTGVPNNGDIEVEVVKNLESGSEGALNMLGNPYASALSAEKLLKENKDVLENGTIYIAQVTKPDFNNPDDDRYHNIVSINATGASTLAESGSTSYAAYSDISDFSIAPGVGFQFMANIKKDANPDGTGTDIFKFKNKMRVGHSESANFRNESVQLREGEYIWCSVEQNGNYSSTLVAFGEQATDTNDFWYDARKVGEMSGLDIGSLIEDEVFSINTLSNSTDSIFIPLRMTFIQPGQAKLKIAGLKGVKENRNLFLYDAVMEKYLPIIAAGDSIEFFVSDENVVNDRFAIVSDIQKSSVHTNQLSDLSTSIIGGNQSLTILSDQQISFELYNIQGVLIQTGQTTHRVDYSLNSGTYVVRYWNENSQILNSKTVVVL